ncbi:3-oxoacyl-ACP reductase FabG [Paenibacillus cisolokensis]|uniref:SDR family NAD(P)-dependent oxidoreductase n=1 Tax=Paenibacillus cisolokensis TaxID=1658519 RepID=UPI003D2B5255
MGSIHWNFKGDHVLVTGGSTGIGRETVVKLARAGAVVHFTYSRSGEAARQLVEQLASEGHTANELQCDFSSAADIQRLTERLTDRQACPIDMIVNNAGVTADSSLYNMSDEQWDYVYQVNLRALFQLSRSMVKHLAVNRGTMVNITSVSGQIGMAGQANYSASKAGIIGFSKALAKELGPLGVRVNCVAPGYIETPMTEEMTQDRRRRLAQSTCLRRFGTSAEVADLILFLLSEHSAYITGEVIGISGGLV